MVARIFIALNFCFLSTISVAQDNGLLLDKIIAKVDNQILLKSEFDIAYIQTLQNEKSFDYQVTQCKVFEALLVNKLMLAKAEIDSVVVDDKQVEAQLERRMDYFIQQIGSKEKLEAYYGKTISQLKAELRKQVKEQLIVQKMQDNITGKIKATPGEVKKFFEEIPVDSLPYFSKEFEIGHIVKVPTINKNNKMLTRKKLENIREMIVNQGEDFAKMAIEFSEDPGSARNGGELGFFKKGELVPEYEAAALSLKPGETSPAIESQFGFHIIQLIERRGSEYNSRHILLKPSAGEADFESTEKFLDSLRMMILLDSITFEKAAKTYSEDKATKEAGGMITDRATNAFKIPAENIDPVLYFMLDTMKAGSITLPMLYRLEDGTEAYRIVYFKSVTQPHQANLIDDYQKIQQACLQEKKNKVINKWFDKTKNEVFISVDPELKDCEILKGLQLN